ncbi:hypothetical protein V5O48_009918 [Marasmius crinis-equi]|uniref:non-specific serine/threonine protein kinase n=1 Tax=Marasmius crinis-equi TaxID=585013 RepID=A0ABR3F9Q6_9AGAR
MPRPVVTDSFPNFTGRLLANSRFKLLEQLGSGAYGKVYRALDLHSPVDDPRYFAVKCLLKPEADSRQEEFQTREFALHKLVSDHPNVVTFHEVFEDHTYIYVLLDFCPGGDLFAAITERGVFHNNDTLVRSIYIQIIDAVQYCHDKGVFHRDLKPENILCSKDGKEIRLADFGLSTQTRVSQDFGCGSSFYMSPECIGKEFRHGKYSTRHSDIWSLGVILINLISGRNPWRYAMTTDECFASFLHDRDFLRTVLPLSAGANRILKRVFHLNPLCRISVPELRREILKLETFFMSDDDLATSPDEVRGIARQYAAQVPSSRPDFAPARPQENAEVSPESKGSPSRVDPEEVYLFASPAEGLQPLRSHPHNALLDAFAIGSHSTDCSSGSTQSMGPVTPETRPVDPEIEVPDMPLDDEQSFITFHTAAAPAKAVERSPRHRAPSGSALKPPPQRVGNQLLKRAVKGLKALSESVSA